MTTSRVPRARQMWLAVLAAFCVLAFGGSPHSASAGAFSTDSLSTAIHTAQLHSTGHHTDSELLTRGLSGPAFSLHTSAPVAGLGVSALLLLLSGWLLGLRRPQRRRVTRFHGPRPARAPPLVV